MSAQGMLNKVGFMPKGTQHAIPADATISNTA